MRKAKNGDFSVSITQSSLTKTFVFLLSPHDSCFQISECVATVPATLKFTVKDCDPTTGEPDSEEGYSDDYQLEDIDITVADYVQRVMKV